MIVAAAMSVGAIEADLEAAGFFQRLAVAVVLGFLIGFERQWRQRAGGLHVVTLVCVGACLFTVPAPLLHYSGDSTRMAAGVISGIGFLAGSVILKEGVNIRGLITAATLWSTAAVGILIGFGYYTQGTVGALTVTAVNFFMQPLVDFIARHAHPHVEVSTLYTFDITCAQAARVRLRDGLLRAARATPLVFRSITSAPIEGDGPIRITAELTGSGYDDDSLAQMTAELRGDPDVSRVSWKIVEQAR